MTRPFFPITHRHGLLPCYDAVIIGSGIGGLICANLLVRAGLKVLLVEQHYMVGGYCSGFRRRGFRFDAASHFYPLLGNPLSISGRLLLDLGIESQWIKMDPVDQFHLPDGTALAVPADFSAYVAELQRRFPAEASAVSGFFQLARQLYLWGLLHFFQEWESSRLKPYLQMTVRDALERYFVSKELKLLLTADCPHWGSPPCRTSFMFDSMLRLSYFEGNYFPRGGSQAFADQLAARFVSLGGQILMKSAVRRIVVRRGRAVAVEVETGPRRFRSLATVQAGCIVSNADMRQTVFEMVGEQHFPAEYVQRLRQLRPSFPCFLSHIGLQGVATDLLQRIHGYYWNDWDSDRVGSDSFQFKLFVPTLYEPELAPRGGHILIVQKVTDVDYSSVTDWQLHKRDLERWVLQRLHELIPGFKERVVTCQSASALTSYRFTLNYHGAMLGWEMSPDQLGRARPANQSPIGDLYFVGHWTRPGGGITPAILSAMNVAGQLTGQHWLRAAHLSDTRSTSPDAVVSHAIAACSATHSRPAEVTT